MNNSTKGRVKNHFQHQTKKNYLKGWDFRGFIELQGCFLCQPIVLYNGQKASHFSNTMLFYSNKIGDCETLL
jgi:hypothetical protein